MAGPILLREDAANPSGFPARRITKDCENSKPVFRSFIASFDVASYNRTTPDGLNPLEVVLFFVPCRGCRQKEAEMVKPNAGDDEAPREGMRSGCDWMHPGPIVRQSDGWLRSPTTSLTGSRKNAHI